MRVETNGRDIGLVAAAYLIWKIVKKTRWVGLDEIPLEEVLERIQPEQVEEEKRGWVKWVSWIWD